jgi:hypothetical protein
MDQETGNEGEQPGLSNESTVEKNVRLTAVVKCMLHKWNKIKK